MILRSIQEVIGYKVHATDGEIGKVADFLFDDERWIIRYLVVSVGPWLAGRKVLVAPASFAGKPDWTSRSFPVALSKQKVKESPDIDVDKPVSRCMEMKLTRYYNWPVYWYPGYDGMPGGSLDPGMFPAPEAEIDGEPCNAHLQSVKDVIGYHVQAQDGSIGHIADFILDDKNWLVRYLVIDTRNWIPGRKVLIPPDWSSSISWAEGVVTIEHTREEVQASPPYDHSAPVNRELEEALYDYYGRPKYWL